MHIARGVYSCVRGPLLLTLLYSLIVGHAIPIARAGDQFSIYVVDNGFLGYGHAYIQLISSNPKNPNYGLNQFFGLYPVQKAIFSRPGVIKDDGCTKWNEKLTYDATPNELDTLDMEIANAILSPPCYSVFGENECLNCVTWLNLILDTIGITLPSYTGRFGLPDPHGLHNTITFFSDGTLFSGGRSSGTLHHNPSPSIASAGGTPCTPEPYRISVEYTVDNLLSDPSSLASSLGLTYHEINRGLLYVGHGHTLTLQVGGVSLSPVRREATESTRGAGSPLVSTSVKAETDALVAVNWGDGSDYDYYSSSFGHAYSDNDDYPVTVGVILAGDLYIYDYTVRVTDTDGNNSDSVSPTSTNDGSDAFPNLSTLPDPIKPVVTALSPIAPCWSRGTRKENAR